MSLSSPTTNPSAMAANNAIHLPSWNDTLPRQALLAFIARVTQEGSPDFVPVAERIAVFDNDGTLWAEQPFYFQGMFLVDRIRAFLPQHPEWRTQEPFASLLRGDLHGVAAAGEETAIEVVIATHTGMTTDEFNQDVTDWITAARHPLTGRLYTDMVYQPMLELLDLLRRSGFKTYIASAGGVEFIRPWAEAVYGIPPEQIIGSSVRLRFDQQDGRPVLVKLPEADLFNDKEGKPVGIYRRIGRRPIAAFGNSDGDQHMLRWTASGERPGFALLFHHDDAEREWAYDRRSLIGRLDAAWDEAAACGWTVVSMKNDWQTVFKAS